MTPILDRIRAHGGDAYRDEWRLKLKRGRLPDASVEWIRRPASRDRLMMEIWPEFEEWSERAAIMEYDGGLPRDEAEALAYRRFAT